MKKVTLLLLLTLVCMGLTSLAVANTTLQLINAPSQIGPYQMSLNGSYLEMVCGSLTKEITQGEIWYVQGLTIQDIANLGGVWGHSAADWNEAAYFAGLVISHAGTPLASQYQQDVWALADGGTQLTQSDDDYYQHHVAGWYHFSGLWYFPLGTPSNPSSNLWQTPDTYGYGLGTPQPFVGAPEPASLLLLGSGLFALALRRRRS